MRYLDDLMLMKRLRHVLHCVDRKETQHKSRQTTVRTGKDLKAGKRQEVLAKETYQAARNLAECLADYLERKEAQDGGIVRATGDGSGKRQAPQ